MALTMEGISVRNIINISDHSSGQPKYKYNQLCQNQELDRG